MEKYIEAIILGIVQGIAEFLPVSSSGHLAIAQHFMSFNEEPMLMSILLHFATLVAVVICFWNDVWGVIKEFFLCIRDIFKGQFSWKNANQHRRMLIIIIVATLPLLLVLPFKDSIESLSSSIFVVGICLAVTGVLLFVSDRLASKAKRSGDEVTVKDGVIVGVAQAIATLPGISRSGSTISTSLILGLEREYAVSLSFLMSLPAVFGATLLEVLDAIETNAVFDMSYLVGMAVAFAVGIASIKLVKWLVKSDRFGKFAYYCFAAAAFAVGVGIFEMLH